MGGGEGGFKPQTLGTTEGARNIGLTDRNRAHPYSRIPI